MASGDFRLGTICTYTVRYLGNGTWFWINMFPTHLLRCSLWSEGLSEGSYVRRLCPQDGNTGNGGLFKSQCLTAGSWVPGGTALSRDRCLMNTVLTKARAWPPGCSCFSLSQISCFYINCYHCYLLWLMDLRTSLPEMTQARYIWTRKMKLFSSLGTCLKYFIIVMKSWLLGKAILCSILVRLHSDCNPLYKVGGRILHLWHQVSTQKILEFKTF